MDSDEKLHKLKDLLYSEPHELSFLSDVHTLARAYHAEHNWALDDDPQATGDMLLSINATLDQIETLLQ